MNKVEILFRPTPVEYGMTEMQKECLGFITDYYLEKSIPPSFDEIKSALGLRSKSGVHRLIVALEERGKICRLPNRARSVKPVFEEDISLRLPAELRIILEERASFHKESLEMAALRVFRDHFFPALRGVS